jgi:hypothetical protein
MTLIAVFARANHPVGYGYGPWNNGSGRAHGYVVIGVRCADQRQVQAVIDEIAKNGLDAPDRGRQIFTDGRPKQRYQRSVWSDGVQRWYSGGPNDWDYLVTIAGERIAISDSDRFNQSGSKGDNRFFSIYQADEVLSTISEEGPEEVSEAVPERIPEARGDEAVEGISDWLGEGGR